MKATEAKLLEFIKKSHQFVIPIYQRSYSWSEKECRQLWRDIVRAGSDKNVNAHFIGSIVYIEKGIYQVTSQSPILVIDGQQRLTTISLLIAALADKLDCLPSGNQENLEGFSPRKLRNYYLRNTEEEGEKHYKLILSKTDKESMIAIVDKTDKPRDHSHKIYKNYALFREWLEEERLEVVCMGIAKLIVVDIALSRDQDNPQLIFESMNSTGKELTQADLIRNYILMGLDIKQQTDLYEHFWRPMEINFGQEAYTSEFDGFIRHYLTVKTGRIPRISEVYENFRKYAISMQRKNITMSVIVEDIRKFSKYFCNMALKQEPDMDLQLAFNDIKELRVDVAYPMFLEVYDDYASGILTKEDIIQIVRIVEAYVFRRHICSIPTNSLNKTFAACMKSVDRKRYVESIKAHFILLPSYRRFPDDIEFTSELQTRDIYNNLRKSYWFKKIENYKRKEQVQVGQYTIEHIMPQNPKLSDEWKEEIGSDWKRVQETWLHTIGNLTLTGYNSEYSDKSFRIKRNMENGFRDSPIKLNNSLRNVEKWNENAIKERAKKLSEIALSVWESPKLPDDVLATYHSDSAYSLSNYRYLSPANDSFVEKVRALFDALRKEILAIDSVVTEEYLKQYIAFKAETNFVDVVPQAERLRLSLNMPFAEINDPKQICKDVGNIGKWGNGDVRVVFDDIKNLPYILSLVRQSFERQVRKSIEK